METSSSGNWKGEVCACLHRWHICWKRSPSNDWWAAFTNEWSEKKKKCEVVQSIIAIIINFKMEKQITSMAATATICWYTVCFISWSRKTPEVCDWRMEGGGGRGWGSRISTSRNATQCADDQLCRVYLLLQPKWEATTTSCQAMVYTALNFRS